MLKKVTGYESELPSESFACETNSTGSLRTLCHQIKTIIPEYIDTIPYLITRRYLPCRYTVSVTEGEEEEECKMPPF